MGTWGARVLLSLPGSTYQYFKFWPPTRLKSWFLELEASNIGYLDPLRWLSNAEKKEAIQGPKKLYLTRDTFSGLAELLVLVGL